jgi:hypothetical protein
MVSVSKYLSQSLAAKQRRRRRVASLPFAKKIEIIEMLRDELKPLGQTRSAGKRGGRAKKSHA